MEQDAKDHLHELIQMDLSGKAAEYSGDYSMLFDYIVNWECRLITPRKPVDT
jgi:hypothetical protein